MKKDLYPAKEYLDYLEDKFEDQCAPKDQMESLRFLREELNEAFSGRLSERCFNLDHEAIIEATITTFGGHVSTVTSAASKNRSLTPEESEQVANAGTAIGEYIEMMKRLLSDSRRDCENCLTYHDCPIMNPGDEETALEVSHDDLPIGLEA